MNKEQLAARRNGIGGSDAAAVLGLSKWKTPLQVYLEKRGEANELEENEEMRWGTAMEPIIREQYVLRTGKRVTQHPMFTSKKYPFMIANLDGVIESDINGVLEVKTSRSSQGWGEPGSDEIPQEYLIQVQHYLSVMNYSFSDVAVLIGGSDFRIYTVEADKELQEMMIEREHEFWEMVQAGEPPAPTCYADAQALFPISKRINKEADGNIIILLDELKNVKESIASQQEREEVLKTMIAIEMGEADTLINAGKILATWRMSKDSIRFDKDAFEEEESLLYRKYLTKVTPGSRRLVIK